MLTSNAFGYLPFQCCVVVSLSHCRYFAEPPADISIHYCKRAEEERGIQSIIDKGIPLEGQLLSLPVFCVNEVYFVRRNATDNLMDLPVMGVAMISGTS